jgi:hypothetical protein
VECPSPKTSKPQENGRPSRRCLNQRPEQVLEMRAEKELLTSFECLYFNELALFQS